MDGNIRIPLALLVVAACATTLPVALAEQPRPAASPSASDIAPAEAKPQRLALPSDLQHSSTRGTYQRHPHPLAQPAWLVPVSSTPNHSEVKTASHEEGVQLAAAGPILDGPRPAPQHEPRALPASDLLVGARQLALRAQTQSDLNEVIEQCSLALDARSDRATAQGVARLAAWAYNRRGELRAARGDERGAFDDFQEAVLLDPSCWEALHNRGVTLACYGKLDLAQSDFDQVVQLNPSFPLVRINRGELFGQKGDWQQAIHEYTAALKLTEEKAPLYAARAHALLCQGDAEQALRDYSTAVALDPRPSAPWIGRAGVYASLGKYGEAIDDYLLALKLDPRSVQAYRGVAWILATCPDERYRSSDKALEAARRAHTLAGDDPAVLDTLAAAYANAGDLPRAIKTAEQAIAEAEEADRPTYRYRLALYRQGEPFRAPLTR